VVTVKTNQQTLQADNTTEFTRAKSRAERARLRRTDVTAEQRGQGHARVEVQRLRTTTRLKG
jgi:hypothetical protein